jgi:hypothetical protein
MKRRLRPAKVFPRLLVAAAMVTGGVVAVATPAAATAQPVTATVHVTAHSATVSGAIAMSRITTPTRFAGPLGQDGRPTGSALPSTTGTAARPTPNTTSVRSGGLNVETGTTKSALASTSAASVTPAALPSIQGGNQNNSGCTNCATPDVTAAVSSTQIAETVNLRLQVLTKSGTSLCTVGLAGLLGATSPIQSPRIQYDNTNKRFSMVIDTVPTSSDDVAVQYLATSQADDACGAWWIYSTIFPSSAGPYPFGALLDFPQLGQDKTSILLSTNNFAFNGSYLGSSAYAEPKSALYSGAGVDFNTYAVAFGTAPVTVAGNPVASSTNTYWLAAVPRTGYSLYAMPTNPAGAISLQANISAPFSAPSRRIRQPGTATTLDPLDGRIGSAAVQAGNVVWFAHDVDNLGFPTVQYGGITVTNNQIETALAFHDSTSDDFNPSVGLSPVSSTTDNIWVNWAYTNASEGIAPSATVAGIPAGEGVPQLDGVDLTLVSGSTTTNTRFGRYSSVAIDPAASSPTCRAGLTALSAQQYFTGGLWTTELARTSFC